MYFPSSKDAFLNVDCCEGKAKINSLEGVKSTMFFDARISNGGRGVHQGSNAESLAKRGRYMYQGILSC
jgi:hypothetical protein